MGEPFYDAYLADIQMAGGITKTIPLKFPKKCKSSAEFTLDYAELDNMITDKTKLLFINNPHNPTGKCWSREELVELSNVVQKYPNLLVVSDEAYEWLTFDGTDHIRLASLPGMWDKTLTICSAGKSFECTGWKIGWMMSKKEHAATFQLAHQWNPFCVSTPLQFAIAKSLQKAQVNGWFGQLQTKLQSRRDKLVDGLAKAGLDPVVPQGGYFVLADTSKFTFPTTPGSPKDFDFARWLIQTYDLGPIPPSSFYSEPYKHLVGDLARFAFCKSDDLIDAGLEKLSAIKV